MQIKSIPAIRVSRNIVAAVTSLEDSKPTKFFGWFTVSGAIKAAERFNWSAIFQSRYDQHRSRGRSLLSNNLSSQHINKFSWTNYFNPPVLIYS